MTIYLKDFNNSQKLTIIIFISSFYQNYFSQKEYYQILMA